MKPDPATNPELRRLLRDVIAYIQGAPDASAYLTMYKRLLDALKELEKHPDEA